MVFNESLSFNGNQLETCSSLSKKKFQTPSPVSRSEMDEAALKLQKVYKSFRTRRQLADCAVLAEQRWWKVLDFAELKHSSISFFEKQETAVSRWSRARTRAAKLGKGLSKDERARKLALQHWLEAIDPRHRYGHNLQFYYVKWLQCDSYQPFFYWLDVGEGKEVSDERCSRSKLQQQCIKYLGPEERKIYEVAIEDGRLFYKQSGESINTTRDLKWIFVLSTSKTLYIGQKNKGTFQHSSFLAGGATLSAGRLVVDDGVVKEVWAHSGHYLPTEENFQEFMSFLEEHNVKLTDVKKHGIDHEEEDKAKMNNGICLGDNPLEADLTSAQELVLPDMENEDCNAELDFHAPLSRLTSKLGSEMDNVSDNFEEQVYTPNGDDPSLEESGYGTAEESFTDEEEFMVPKSHLFEEQEEEENERHIPKENIMKIIDSHKGMKSCQLGNHLSTEWRTGSGSRIGCLRDYPAKLSFRIPEHQHLSPRRGRTTPSHSVLQAFHLSLAHLDFVHAISAADVESPNSNTFRPIASL
ncbi:IQ domain-containing protein IQM6 [Arachis stenosperma]|uniref:IQ domain-containing protein IQM6 n=1 Tax=Arachis stenosperma TaxID=217475 RepID=UPI0025ABF48A|nr:IQ domain-containing protein IQM6 [Arachis stenosperma]